MYITSHAGQLYTLPEVAKRFGVTERRCEYAAKLYRVEPVRRIGITRIYDEAAAVQIGEAIEAVAAKREGAHACA